MAQSAPLPAMPLAMQSAEGPWFTALRLAELRLEGLPQTKRGVNWIATENAWIWRDQPIRGGVSRLYPLSALPEAAQADWAARQALAAGEVKVPVGRPRGSSFFERNPHMADAVIATLSSRRVSARNMRKLLAAYYCGEPVPTLRTVQRFIRQAEIEHRIVLAAQRDPDLYKSRFRPALGRADASVSYAHQVWEIDTTKADVLCTDGRKAILGIIDRWSRRARYQVVESESAQSVRRMLTDTIRAWGVMPERLKVDNGSGFINTSVRTACEALDIVLDACLPGHPEDKPFVERLFGTFTRDRASMLGGFAGHNVAQAQALRAAAKKRTGRALVVPEITSEHLQEIIDSWIDGEYHRRRHSTLAMSPMEKWQRSTTPARAAPSDDVLRVALSAYVGTAKVGKRGVRWKSGRYWHSELTALMDRNVVLRRDEDDLGALFIFDEDGQYRCTAVNWERSGLSEQAFAMAARADMERMMAAQRQAMVQRKRTFSFEKARDMMLRAEAEEAGKLAHLPMPTRTHETATMASIRPPEPATPMDRAQVEAILAEPAPRQAAPAIKPADKVAQADALLAAAGRGEAVDPTALTRARTYAQSPEYRVQKIMHAEFGGRADPAAPPCNTKERTLHDRPLFRCGRPPACGPAHQYGSRPANAD